MLELNFELDFDLDFDLYFELDCFHVRLHLDIHQLVVFKLNDLKLDFIMCFADCVIVLLGIIHFLFQSFIICNPAENLLIKIFNFGVTIYELG